MHILLIHQAFASINEAGGTRHHELAQYLVQRGHRVTVITSPVSYLSGQSKQSKPAWVRREEPQDGITILRAYTYPAFHRSFFHRMIGFISFMMSSFLIGLGVKQVDLVWGSSPPIFQGLTAWLVARLKGKPFLFEVRDLWPAFAIAVGVLKNPLLIGLARWLEKFLYRHADRVVVNSPGFISHVTSRGAAWVELVPNGADPDLFSPASRGEGLRKEHHLEDAFIVMYAGAHGMSNDLGVVLQAARRLQHEPGIHILLVGDGKEKANLQAQAREMGLQNVTFLPPVAKAEMGEVMAAADACIAILKPLDWYKTTYPNKVFDYMAAGRPVLCAIDGVIRDVVEQAGAGLFVPPGDACALADAILELAHQPEKARQMGVSGCSYIAAHFSRARLAEQLAFVLEEMGRA